MRIVRWVLFSFLFHFLLLLGIYILGPLLEPKPPETIEVELAPPPPPAAVAKSKKPEQQFVRKSLVPDKMKAPEDETLARFLSEQKQRVKQESQAAESGMTENRSNTSEATTQKPIEKQTPQKAEQKQPAPEEKDKDGWRTVDISKELNEMNQLSDGRSTVGEALPTDVKVGSFTALNTDRYLYYTFYARVEELVRYRWETRVQNAIYNFDRMTAASMGNRNWNTYVEFLLDRKGNLQKALVMKESGVRAFDASAVDAFKDARVFPNPPQEMVQDDGYIHLKFTFTVNFSPNMLGTR